jgi:pimeloyl-ACP methyl ester carboxylesterase
MSIVQTPEFNSIFHHRKAQTIPYCGHMLAEEFPDVVSNAISERFA